MPITPPNFVHYTPDSSKAERFGRVAQAVISVMLARGAEAVTVSAVARSAGVSRGWIYKYVGRERDDLFEVAVKQFGGAFTELDRPVEPCVDTTEWLDRLRTHTHKALDDAEAAPWVLRLYFRHRHDHGRIGEALRAIEDAHRARFCSEVPAELARRKGPARVDRFARVFAGTRNGFYFLWTDPAQRALHDRDGVVDELLSLARDFAT